MNDLKKFLLLAGFEMKRRLGQSRTLLTVLLIFLVLSHFFLLFRQNSEKPLRKIALVLDDPSPEIRIFVGNISGNRLKGIFAFEEMELPEARRALGEKQIFAVLHIKADIFKKLNRFEEESLDLYLSDSGSPVARFFIAYVDNLTQVLNEAQSSARVYLRKMRSLGVPEEEIWDRLTKIQLDYISAFLTRSSVFESSEAPGVYFGLDGLSYYFFSALLLLLIFSSFALLHPLREDLRSGRWRRLSLSGYDPPMKAASHLLASAAPLCLLLILMRGGYSLLTSSKPSMENLFALIGRLLLIGSFISLLSLTLTRLLAESPYFDRLCGAIFLLLALISGFLIPLPALGKSFLLMEKINPLTISHKLLSGAKLSFFTFLPFAAGSILCIALLAAKERR
ncbi:MAG: ABC transporter permease [Peptostreptococcaceae bacterium]|nr:ABC transporter permease [Peptostreptococcaceae bacterium]